MEFRCGDFQRRLRKPVSDTVRARDLQREGTNKEMGNAVSQRNFLNYTRHSFPSLFNPYFLHLKIFQKSAKTNALLGRDIWFYWFHRSFRWKFVVFVSKREKKKTKFDGRKKKEAIQSRKSETTRYPFIRFLLFFRPFLTNFFITTRSKTRNEQSPWNKRRIFQAEEKSTTIHAC